MQVDWINLAQDGDLWQVLTNTVIPLNSMKAGEFSIR